MSKYDTSLTSKGYLFSPKMGLWARRDPASFSYSDGDDTEQNLFRTIQEATDISLFSQELRAACTDWPTTYHLSPSRGNLLRPAARLLQGRVLEIGAGCGAITRFLGENAGDVLALEGSQRRAAIAAQRTRDLSNVTVINEKFEDFVTDVKFDAITLIGVLEYAGEFNRTENAPLEMLKIARRLLKPAGVLIVAIENQLGLKYLAGAPEDHIGSQFVGIHDLYSRPGVRTFGRRMLEQLIRAAGFENLELALPFPDYKLPTTIILPAGYDQSTGFDGGALAAQVSSRDLQLSSRDLSFSLERAWRTVGENFLLPDLANSFLFLGRSAQSESDPLFDENALAYHFSTERRPSFCKMAKFSVDGLDGISVINSLIQTDQGAPAQSIQYAHRVPQDSYRSGPLFSEKFILAFQKPGWTAKEISNLLNEYLEIVVMHSGHLESAHIKSRLEQLIPGQYLDLIPQNIIITKSGFHVIDQEWTSEEELSLAYLSFRALTTCVRMISSFAVPGDLRWLTVGRLFEDVFSHLDFDLLEADYQRFALREAAFMSFASGTDASPIAYSDWHAQVVPSFVDKLSDRSFVARINELSELAETYLRQIKWLESENAALHEQLANQSTAFNENNDRNVDQIRWLESENERLNEKANWLEPEFEKINEQLDSVKKTMLEEANRRDKSLLERIKRLF